VIAGGTLSIVIALMLAPTAPASTRPTTSASGKFEVQDWVVLVCDPNQPQASADGLVMTSLPQTVDSRRKRAPATKPVQPCPIGVIRVYGSGDAKIDAKLDVKLELPNGRLMSTWPKAHARAAHILWRDMALSADPSRVEPIDDEEHWLRTLRQETSAYFTSDGRSERFLLYDVEVKYELPLRFAGGRTKDDALQVANASGAPVHDLVLYRADGASWRSAELAELPVGRKPTTAPASAPASGPATAPTTQSLGVDPADVRHVRLAATSSNDPATFLAEWKKRLTRAGLRGEDPDLIVRILQFHALDPKRLTAVYRLDAAELDRLLPLEVLPEPAKTVRVGLVIVRNADPAVPAEIDDLIVQLGDRDWRKREAASKALAELGPAAKSKLESASKNSDPEVVIRAERLLAGMGK
jgi:hypothetical protein